MEEYSSELFVRNIDYSASARELVFYLESLLGKGTVEVCEIMSAKGASRGFGFIQFESGLIASRVMELGCNGSLRFRNRSLEASPSKRRLPKKQRSHALVEGGVLYVGNLSSQDQLDYLWKCSNVSAEFFYSYPAKFHILFKSGRTEYKLEVASNSIVSVESCMASGSRSLLFQLYYPPRISKRSKELYDDLHMLSFPFSSMQSFKYSKEDPWIRTTDFTTTRALGQSVVFCLLLPYTSTADIRKILGMLSDYYLGDFRVIRLTKGTCYATEQEVVPILEPSLLPEMAMELEFKLNSLLQHGYISPTGLTDEFLHLLDPATNTLEQCISALTKFEEKEHTRVQPFRELNEYLTRGASADGQCGPIKLDSGQVYVKRVTITPTKAYFHGPDIEQSNRVTRSFISHIDNFLRVTFTEEDYETLGAYVLAIPRTGGVQAGENVLPNDVYRRILLILHDGIRFAGKHFQFLAFSSSQLRENSLWMFANEGLVTGESIRSWMGDFDHIRNVAKYAARMGQSFSSSTHTLDVPAKDIYYLRDIMTVYQDVEYVFSDGIGTISWEFAKRVALKCRLKFIPSAFQIRYGGSKGVVAVDPRTRRKLSLRPSMVKFHSLQTGLDVITWTRFIPCYLNRQLITLLSTLGVPDVIFESMQQEAIQQLDLMVRDSSAAVETLSTFYVGNCHKFILEMLQAGYSPTEEPYLRSLLKAFRDSQLYDLQTKARVFVSHGRRLMGCLDETGTLEYGQCFVQVSPPPENDRNANFSGFPVRSNRGVSGDNRAFVVEGGVVVARNPCLHPGDVLVLDAVDVPALHHMVDCIVFPQRGHRPHPNECSGGDLDGDLYFVSWDKKLIPQCRYLPMVYEPVIAQTLDREVSPNDIYEFFLDHMINNSVGVISNAHLVHASASPSKALDMKCMELAELFSTAVDFPKTGKPATIPVNLRPQVYPDFMEKEDKPTERSESVLGKLFRAVKGHTLELALHLAAEDEYDWELIVPDYSKYLDDARECRESYNNKLLGLMSQYELSEAEIMSGNIRGLSKYYKNQRNVETRIVMAANSLVKEAREWFEEGGESGEEADAKASAWYHVTYHPAERTELLSFPWVVSDRLLRIKSRFRLIYSDFINVSSHV